MCIGDVIAKASDIPMLSEMRWEHEYEEVEKFDISKEDFTKECNLFLANGLKNGTWEYWIAEENNKIELLFVWPSQRAVTFYERQGFSMNNEIMELEL